MDPETKVVTFVKQNRVIQAIKKFLQVRDLIMTSNFFIT